jgi:hypothetical protein
LDCAEIVGKWMEEENWLIVMNLTKKPLQLS